MIAIAAIVQAVFIGYLQFGRAARTGVGPGNTARLDAENRDTILHDAGHCGCGMAPLGGV
jgi:hypothetical protein